MVRNQEFRFSSDKAGALASLKHPRNGEEIIAEIAEILLQGKVSKKDGEKLRGRFHLLTPSCLAEP